MGTVRFGNDHFATITGYGDYVQGNPTICHVYYVEGLRHNLFSVRRFCDGDLEVAFQSNTCYVRNLEGEELLTGSRDSNLYTISIYEMAASSPFKYDKDHLCSACEQGKSKKAILNPKLVPSTNSKLELIHMDLCGPMRVESINGKRYILIQQNMRVQILKVQSDNGTEFKNEKLRSHYEKLGIIHQTSIARMTQQNGVVERRNRTLVKMPAQCLSFQNYRNFHGGRKPNVQYFHVFGSLCNPTNDYDDLGKMKPNENNGIFIGYSESSRGFQIYNRRTRKIMETIHVKFDELTTMASECNNSGPDTPSSSSIIVEEHEAPQLVSSSEEPIANEPTTLASDDNADESVQEDIAELDGNTFINPFHTPCSRRS
ncbi:retrovirus-related pol polyprotein from transposon TNT 1-94 [Tanacetum coccineum]